MEARTNIEIVVSADLGSRHISSHSLHSFFQRGNSELFCYQNVVGGNFLTISRHIITPITWLELIDLINSRSIQFYKSFLEEKYNVNTKRAIVKNTITVKV